MGNNAKVDENEESVFDEIVEKKEDNNVIRFVRKHKNKIIVGLGLAAGVVLAYLKIKNHEGAQDVLEDIGEEVGKKVTEPTKLAKYSHEWISSLSDEQWEKEREILRLEWCSGTMTTERAIQVEKLLHSFDVIKEKRAWEGKPYSGPVHSEHGWYLPSDD